MKRVIIFLAFPYLGPLIVALLAEQSWRYFAHLPSSQTWVSGGEVPSYFILIPIGFILQIFIGIPGNWILKKCNTRVTALCTAMAMTFLPLTFFRSSPAPNQTTIWPDLVMTLLPIVSTLGIGAFVSYHCLYTTRFKSTNQHTHAAKLPS